MMTALHVAIYLMLFIVAVIGSTLVMFLTFAWVEHLVTGAFSNTRAWNYAFMFLVLILTGSASFLIGMSQGKRAQLTREQIIDIARSNFIEALNEKKEK